MQQELYHEIFGSILDRREMTPYLLQHCVNYEEALNKASRMMANRGFDISGACVSDTEKKRAMGYVSLAIDYLLKWLFPFLRCRAASRSSLRRAAGYGAVSPLTSCRERSPNATSAASTPSMLVPEMRPI